MKIRTDFVTNSSSSSFVAINIEKQTVDSQMEQDIQKESETKSSNSLLNTYLKEHRLFHIFSDIEYGYSEWRCLQAELEKSFALSLCAILETYLEDYDFYDFQEELDEEAIKKLIQFLQENQEAIDSETEGSIELRASDGEDGFAYVQCLQYKNHHGTLTKWPCSNGWEDEGYEKIQQFHEKMFAGEIEELAGLLSCYAIWDIVWQEEDLEIAIEKTGHIEEFDI